MRFKLIRQFNKYVLPFMVVFKCVSEFAPLITLHSSKLEIFSRDFARIWWILSLMAEFLIRSTPIQWGMELLSLSLSKFNFIMKKCEKAVRPCIICKCPRNNYVIEMWIFSGNCSLFDEKFRKSLIQILCLVHLSIAFDFIYPLLLVKFRLWPIVDRK